jgi:hypothetical protein
MRKHQQKQILDLLGTLEEVQSAGLYADAQEGALQIGEFIESVEGESTRTVELLEEYCELLYMVSTGKQSARTLKKQLYKVENSVKSELKPNRIEVAFFPYKASMADSLQTIWEAAIEDPDCDVVICPIPYYDRLPDGSFGEMHYEGTEYSKNLPLVNWQVYDVEARHPDVIFVHNPYDEGNYVTSVHPDFYSKRLRDCTDLLCYVPYFVVVDDVSEHFCTTAGCMYAHKVIVQSDKVRDTYVRVFKEAYGNQFGKPEDKFLALGSPKFDLVLSTKREDCQLPDEWREIIGDKKVVLYNTTVGALLQDTEQYLKKLRSVLEMFRNRDDVVLWWRPHPLIEATLESMRSEFAAEFRAIVEGYTSDEFGVFDDSDNLNRAIAYSAAYYGDGSSLVALYEVTGKPIMQQSVPTIEYAQTFIPRAIFVYGNKIYFTIYWRNQLFSMDLINGVVELIGEFSDEDSYPIALYNTATVCNGKAYFSPVTANAIGVFNIETKTTSGILENERYRKEYYPVYHRVHTIGERVYFIGYCKPAITCLDTNNNTFSYYDDWVKEIHSDEKIVVWLYDSCVSGQFIAAVSNTTSNVVVFDTITKLSKVYNIGNGISGFEGICYDGKDFWLAPKELRCVIKWNPWTATYVEFIDFPLGFKRGATNVWGMFGNSNYVWVLSCHSNMLLKINVNTGAMFCEKEFFSDNTMPRYPGSCEYSDCIYAAASENNEIILINKSTSKINYIKMDASQIPKSVFQMNISANMPKNDNHSIGEMGLNSLSSYLNALVKMSDNSIELKNKNAGLNIYSYIKRNTVMNI